MAFKENEKRKRERDIEVIRLLYYLPIKMEKKEKADFWDLMYYLFGYIRVVKFVAPIITRYNNLKYRWDRNKTDIGRAILFCLGYAIRYGMAMYACSIME